MYLPTTLALLTWKSPRTLEKTLASLESVTHLFQERIIVCQEANPNEIDLAVKYGYVPVVTEVNLGIQGGIQKAVVCSSNANVFFLENDCPYIGDNTGMSIIKKAMRYFDLYQLDIMKFQRPEMSKKFRRYWHEDKCPRRKIYGVMRGDEANSCVAESISSHLFDCPNADFLYRIDDGFFVTDSRYIKWTNRPFLVRKSFFINTIMDFANAHPGKRLVNEFPDLEFPINCPKNRWWWRSKRFRIGLMRYDLFGHSRYDRPPEDEKWVTGAKVAQGAIEHTPPT